MKILYFDCSNGVSADMILNALLSIGKCEAEVREKMDECDGVWGSDTEHGRKNKEIRKLIDESGFSKASKEMADKMYGKMAKAEAAVHDMETDTVHFHEVGRNEAVKNALGIGMALEKINADKILVSDIYDGKGTIVCSHGEIPVPVPAVMELRRKCRYEFKTADVNTEMVTPSGLAALMSMGAEPGKMKGDVIRRTEAKGTRDTGRGGLKVFLTEEKAEESKEAAPVTNPKLKLAAAAVREKAGQENSVRLLNEVVRAKLLIPVSMDKQPVYDKETDEIMLEDDTEISFELIKAQNGDLYYPVFTDGEEMRKCGVDREQHSLIVNFDDLAAMLLQPQNGVKGFAINPMSDNLCFNTDMIAAMKKDMEKEI